MIEEQPFRCLKVSACRFREDKGKDTKTESCGADGKKYYVIDTNVFIDQPDILERLKEDEIAVLALTVVEELKYRLNDVNTKYSAEKALQRS